MRKTVVFSALAVFCVLLAGCHNTDEITREDLSSTAGAELKRQCEPFDITVTTTGADEYKFAKDNFRIHGDTLTGFGTRSAGGNEVPFRGSIPLSDVQAIETKEYSVTKTVLLIVIPSGVIVGFLIWFGNEMAKI